MNERLTLQDLVDLLAKKQDITKKDAEAFLRELITLIAETIEQNEPVKIKDFGTFKLTKVNARKSVDVNTGEAIEIAAHYKLSFTPDKSLREAINKPFAHFESVILEEGVSFDNIESHTEESLTEESEVEAEDIEIAVEEFAAPQLDQTPSMEERIAEILDGGEYTPTTTPVILENEEPNVIETKAETIVEPIEEALSSDNNAPSEEEVEPITVLEDEVVTEPLLEEEHIPSSEYIEQSPIINRPETKNYNYEQKESILNRIPRWVAFAVALIAIIVIVGIILRPQISSYLYDIKEDISLSKVQEDAQSRPQLENYVAGSDSTDHESDSTAIKPTPTDIAPPIAETTEKAVKESTTYKSKTATIESGMTLRMLGLEHYGNKSFWVYIYQENKSKITNPNNVPLGTVLTIPAKEKYGIDPKSPESVKKARQLEEQIFKEFE